MKNTAISTFQILEAFPDAETARKYIENRRWPEGVVCPFCEDKNRIKVRDRAGFYRCNACLKDFTVRTGTIFERSHIPLNKWIFALYLLVTARKGISSLQLSKELGITQKASWFCLRRIREACGNDLVALKGIVEIDETYVGGKEKNKHAHKKLDSGRGTYGKTPVFGMRERGGRTRALPIDTPDRKTISSTVLKNVEEGSTLNTDEFSGYETLKESFYKIKSVNHGAKEYVRKDVTTNGIESVWAVLKRGLNGVYHHVDDKHLARYVNEFTFRLNDGNVTRTSMERLSSLIKASVGRRITYKQLTGGAV